MVIFNFAASGSKHFLCPLRKCKKILLSTIKTKVRNKYSTYNKESCVPRNGPWNVLFFGTDEFAVESLKTLHNKYKSKVLQRLEVVVTDKGKDNPVAKYAMQKDININKWPLEIGISNFHIGIVVSFGHLIPSSVINSFPLGMLNVHGSLLPKWRGAAPIIHSLMNGDQQTGITIMKIIPKRFDIGEIVLQREIDIAKNDMLPELYTRLAKLGADLLGKTFDNLLELLESATPQDSANATYAPKITRKMSAIKWNEMSAKNVYDLNRALLGVYPLTATFQDRVIKLHHIENIEDSIVTKLEGETPGTVIYSKKKNALLVKCKGETWISVKKVVVSCKRPMNACDFYNGFIAGKNKTKTLFS